MNDKPTDASGISREDPSPQDTITPPAPEVPVELFKTLGHDVRNALTSIQLLTQIALRHKETATAEHLRNFLTKIDGQSAKLCAVVDDLLDVVRIQAGRLTIRKQPADLDTVLQEVRKKVSAGAPVPAITWGSTPPGTVELDPVRMTQVLTCILLHGAANLPGLTGIGVHSALTDGSLQVRMVFSHPEEEAADTAFRGLAGPEEHQSPDPALFIVSEIIRLHEGTVRIGREPGAGTTVHLTVPVRTESVQ